MNIEQKNLNTSISFVGKNYYFLKLNRFCPLKIRLFNSYIYPIAFSSSATLEISFSNISNFFSNDIDSLFFSDTF